MNPPVSFLWHDYETFGTHPALDRPAQFAALRTDADLNLIGESLEWFCAPADDMLPHPAACLITGITPQIARDKGVIEAEFARLIHDEMMEPGTCSAGYNSLRFDDEFTRHIFYRNFYDPYEREYRNGNSRWDLIDLARICYALRPEGINWPLNDEGSPSFKLEHLTAANNIDHPGAHDALTDVRATIGLARLLRKNQPKLFHWVLGLRDQKQVIKMLDTVNPQPILHTSSRIPAARGCTSLFLALAGLPDRPKSVIAFDLMADPAELISSSAEEIADLVFTPASDLPGDKQRLPLKAIHSNKVPVIAPRQVLTGVDLDRIGLDPGRCDDHARQILKHLDVIRYKVMEVFGRTPESSDRDPDVMLYGGDFFSAADRALMNQVIAASPEQLASRQWQFRDRRLPVMLLRYRARNYPQTLSEAEANAWRAYCKERLFNPPLHGYPGLHERRHELRLMRMKLVDDTRALLVLDQVEAWFASLEAGLN